MAKIFACAHLFGTDHDLGVDHLTLRGGGVWKNWLVVQESFFSLANGANNLLRAMHAFFS